MRYAALLVLVGLVMLGGSLAGCTSRCESGQVPTDNGCAMACNTHADCTQREICQQGACVTGDRFSSTSSSSSTSGALGTSTPQSSSATTSGPAFSSSAPSSGVGTSSVGSVGSSTSLPASSSSLSPASSSVTSGSTTSTGGTPGSTSGPASSSNTSSSSSSGVVFPMEVEPNNTDATAQPYPATGPVMGNIPQTVPAMADVDVFSVLVGMDGMALRATVLNAAGNCDGLGDPYLRFRDAAGTELATDDDGSGNSLCPALEPRRNVRLRNLAQGTYYVQVNALGAGQAIPNYVLTITLIPAGCPNGLVDGAETCDDGNTTPGDGCNGACQLELPLTPEVEPNNAVGNATPLSGGSVGWRGAFPATSDVDWFELGLTQPSNLAVEVGDGLGGCLMRGNVTVFNADGGTLGQAGGDCPAVDPRTQAALQLAPPGTYRIRVRTTETDVPTYVARVRATQRTCGDLLPQVPEECDDGNAVTGDGCSPACALEGIVVVEQEPNDTVAQAQPWNGQRLRGNHAASPTDADVYALDVGIADATVVVTLDDGRGNCPAFGKDLALLDAMGAVITGAVGAPAPGAGCIMLDGRRQPQLRSIPPGPLLVRVGTFGPDVLSTYVLTSQVLPPACGDGVLHPGRNEACDDGNTLAGDGCGATCLWEVPAESEPNGTAMADVGRLEANALPALPAAVMGNIFPTTDLDWFAFDHAGGPLRLQTTGASATTCPGDTILALWDAMGTAPLAENDDALGNLCSLIDGTGAMPPNPEAANLPGGRYFVAVRPFSPTEILGYRLTVTP